MIAAEKQGDLFAEPSGETSGVVRSPVRLPDRAAQLSGVLFERDDRGNLIEEVYEYDTPE